MYNHIVQTITRNNKITPKPKEKTFGFIFFAFLANLKQKEGKKLLLQNNKK